MGLGDWHDRADPDAGTTVLALLGLLAVAAGTLLVVYGITNMLTS